MRPATVSPARTTRTWLNRTANMAVSTPAGINCCGLGGVVQLTNRQLSMKISNACWSALAPAPGTQVITGCSGCAIQLTTTRPPDVEVAHWLDIVQP